LAILSFCNKLATTDKIEQFFYSVQVFGISGYSEKGKDSNAYAKKKVNKNYQNKD